MNGRADETIFVPTSLEAGVRVDESPTPARPPNTPTAPSFDSRYAVLAEVGQGGMGRVLRAYDTKLQREVALKQVRRDTFASEDNRRLVAEARAMAKLAHPNVVAVYDVRDNADADEVVLVMEYVPGQTLKQWLAERPRTWREVVIRFIAAGRGLAAAHTVGLLHRDFKPANVLVTERQTKVTDFGIAQGIVSGASSHDDLDAPDIEDVETRTVSGVGLGTPRYMAPEQTARAKLTAAADQYAFCVALWELLCGHAPVTGENLQTQKTHGPPLWTNAMACLHRANIGFQAVVGVLTTADTKVAQKTHEVLSDLPALERCTNIEALQADVEPPAPDEADAVDRARTHLAKASAEYMGGRNNVAQNHIDAARTILAGVDYRPVRAEFVLQHGRVLEGTGDYESAIATLERALELAARSRRPDVMRHAAAKLVFVVGDLLSRVGQAERYFALLHGLAHTPKAQAEVANRRAILLRIQGRYEAAEAEDRRVLALRERAFGPEHPRVADSRTNLAISLWGQARYEDAEAEYRRALAIYEHALGPEHPRVAMSYNKIGRALLDQGRYQRAESELRHAFALYERALGADHPFVARIHDKLGKALREQGHYEQAESEFLAALALFERVVGSDHPLTAEARTKVTLCQDYIADAPDDHERQEPAEAEFRRALAIRQQTLGPDHPRVADSRNNLGLFLVGQQRHAEAEVEHRQALALYERVLGPDHPGAAKSHAYLGEVLLAQGRPEGATTHHRRALALRERTLGSEHPLTAQSRSNLAEALLASGRTTEALDLASSAYAQLERGGVGPHRRAKAAFALARALATTGRALQRSRHLAERALADYRSLGWDRKAAEVETWLRRFKTEDGGP